MSTIERCSQRQQQPWTRGTKPYVVHTPQGLQSLADLFDGRTHLIVQHFALAAWKGRRAGRCFAPDDAEHFLACLADDDVASVAVSRAPLAEIEAVKRRMGWRFRWGSSNGRAFHPGFPG